MAIMKNSTIARPTKEHQFIGEKPGTLEKKAWYKRVWDLLDYLIPTVGTSFYLFTLGIFRSKNRALVHTTYQLICPRLFAKKIVPQVEITSLVPDTVSLRLCEQIESAGNTSFEELFVFAELLQARQPGACFEIGTFDGRSTLNMAANTPDDAVIYTLDLPQEQMDSTVFQLDPLDLAVVEKEISGARYRGTPWEYKIQQLYGDSAAFDFAPYQGKMDFVFIDGSHTYEYVLNDSRKALTLLRNGKGMILWHDYPSMPSVLRAINDLQATDSRFTGICCIKGTRFACLICR